MKKSVLLTVLILAFLPAAQNQARNPSDDCPGQKRISAGRIHHCALEPTKPALKNRGKLVLFLIGTGTRPEWYSEFARHAANLGYHVLTLNYYNRFSTIHCRPKDFAVFRDRIILGGRTGSDKDDGTPARTVVCRAETFPLEKGLPQRVKGIEKRLNRITPKKAIIPLAKAALKELARGETSGSGWDEFVEGDSMAWERIILAGHSQGAGHAAYIAKKIADAHRLILFSGPPECDNRGKGRISLVAWSRNCNKAVRWLLQWGSKTHPAKFHSVYAEHDQITSRKRVGRNFRLLTLTSPGDPPYPMMLRAAIRISFQAPTRVPSEQCMRLFFRIRPDGRPCDIRKVMFQHNAAIVDLSKLDRNWRKYAVPGQRKVLWSFLLRQTRSR